MNFLASVTKFLNDIGENIPMTAFDDKIDEKSNFGDLVTKLAKTSITEEFAKKILNEYVDYKSRVHVGLLLTCINISDINEIELINFPVPKNAPQIYKEYARLCKKQNEIIAANKKSGIECLKEQINNMGNAINEASDELAQANYQNYKMRKELEKAEAKVEELQKEIESLKNQKEIEGNKEEEKGKEKEKEKERSAIESVFRAAENGDSDLLRKSLETVKIEYERKKEREKEKQKEEDREEEKKEGKGSKFKLKFEFELKGNEKEKIKGKERGKKSEGGEWRKVLKTNHGQSPLHFAAGSGSKECVRILIEYGFNIDEKDVFGNKPIDWSPNPDIFEF